jgi:hypothetical protein
MEEEIALFIIKAKAGASSPAFAFIGGLQSICADLHQMFL